MPADNGTGPSGQPQGRVDTQVRPALAATYEGGDPALLERILPLVDYVEVTPDALAEAKGDQIRLHAGTMAELKNIGDRARIIVHGVGLSIGSHDGYSQRYIRLLDDVMEQLDVEWHSEHLGYTRVDGEHMGTMLAVPKTDEMLDLLAERVTLIQERYGLPFLLENVVQLLPDEEGDYSEAEFLNALVARTGCGLLVDAYNLECDVHNNDLDIQGFLAELDMSPVREIHLAGGVEHRGFKLDIHSRLLDESTIALGQQIVKGSAGNVRAVTYEFLPQAVPALGHEAIVAELAQLRRVFCD